MRNSNIWDRSRKNQKLTTGEIAAEAETNWKMGFGKRAGAPGKRGEKQEYQSYHEGKNTEGEFGTGADS